MNQREAELKRFLDRLLSQPQREARVDAENWETAAELGLVGPDVARSSTPAQDGHEKLIELTRRAIRGNEPEHADDESLETMSAPPPMPEAVP